MLTPKIKNNIKKDQVLMLSLKDDVDEVTIIELDPNVKKMFEMYLKPQMNNKISIFQGDAIQFLERENISMYQYCSVDIWQGAMDMFPIYLKCLLLEQRYPLIPNFIIG